MMKIFVSEGDTSLLFFIFSTL